MLEKPALLTHGTLVPHLLILSKEGCSFPCLSWPLRTFLEPADSEVRGSPMPLDQFQAPLMPTILFCTLQSFSGWGGLSHHCWWGNKATFGYSVVPSFHLKLTHLFCFWQEGNWLTSPQQVVLNMKVFTPIVGANDSQNQFVHKNATL